MTLLDAATLAELRALNATARPDSAVVTRSGATIAGLLWQPTVDSKDALGAIDTSRGRYRFDVARDADILVNDILTISGRVFRVRWVPALSTYDTGRIVGLDEVQ